MTNSTPRPAITRYFTDWSCPAEWECIWLKLTKWSESYEYCCLQTCDKHASFYFHWNGTVLVLQTSIELLLCVSSSPEEIPGILTSKLALRYNSRHLDAMREVGVAAKERSLGEFLAVSSFIWHRLYSVLASVKSLTVVSFGSFIRISFEALETHLKLSRFICQWWLMGFCY